VAVLPSVTLPVPPSTNRLYNRTRYGVRLSDEARDYHTLVAYTVPVDMQEGKLVMVVDYYRPRKRGDVDGPIKLLQDCLQGKWYANDDQIVTLLVRRHEDKLNPRVEVTCGNVSKFDITVKMV